MGGGVIGLSLAWELVRRQCDVTLLERDAIGKATSWAAVGILPPANFQTATDPIDRLRGLSHRLYPDWTRELHELTKIDPGFRRCGGWYLANTPGERAAMVGMTQYWNEMNIQCESVDLQELARRERAIATWADNAKRTSAWWTPDECQVRSPDLLMSLQSACQKSGVQLVENFDVVDVNTGKNGARVTGREKGLGEQSFQGDIVVVCGGPWTGRIASCLKLDESIVPIRGQVLLFKSPAAICSKASLMSAIAILFPETMDTRWSDPAKKKSVGSLARPSRYLIVCGSLLLNFVPILGKRPKCVRGPGCGQ